MHFRTLTAAALVATSALGLPKVGAATVTDFNFGVEVTSASTISFQPIGSVVGETGTLQVSVPTSDIQATGYSQFDPFSGLMVDLSIFGQAFTEVDDVDYDFNPFLQLFNGEPVYFEMTVSEFGFGCCGLGGVATPIDDPRILAFSVFGGEFDGQSPLASIEVDATVVPLPPAALMFAGPLAAFGAIRLRRKV